MKLTSLKIAMICLIALASAGCGGGGYVRVVHPSSGRVYYANGYDQYGGTIVLTDAKTKATVFLDASEIYHIDGDEFARGARGEEAQAK